MRTRGAFIVIAVVLALVGTGALYSYLKGADERALSGKQPASVWIVTKRIPANLTVDKIATGGYARRESVPEAARPTDALVAFSDVTPDEVALAEIQTGQVLMHTMFGALPPATSGLAIPDNMVAVSILVSSNADVAGHVQAGSQIAIFDTFILLDAANGSPAGTKEGGAKTDNWATRLLLPKVLVLAVSGGVPSDTKQATSTQSLLVTVAVTQADAERVIHVMQTGNLYLALLSAQSVTAPAPGVDNQGKLGPVFPRTVTSQGG